ncbi:trace amine-associated receptor 5-like [Actinia tenebrosa]|uniref:Trace amine-associated receptor 5-like n=1 Tax=Actinia tenebrosa TaxID=6105 RepID=A0A6P8HE62_ACTTE|nr:trace amine-associated receptor 5-like [Actinia tenebrosa]
MMLHIVMLAFYGINSCDATTNKNTACEAHLNTSWDGNSTCAHSRDSECNVHVTCGLKTITQLVNLISSPEAVSRLDISKNSLVEIKEHMFLEYKNLVALDLSYNSIQVIQRKAFNGLMKLKTLDLSFNLLHEWDTLDITKQLPSLTELNITGNPFWSPGQHIRDLPNISYISGIVTYALPYENKNCVLCELQKHADMKNRISKVNLVTVDGLHCFELLIDFGANFSAVWHSNFSITCAYRYDLCKSPPFTKPPSNISVEFIDGCFLGIRTWGLPNIPIGIATMMVNFVVMATVALTPSLFKKANMVLMASMGLGDFLQGLWLLILTIVRISMSSLEFFDKKMPYLCYSLFALLVTAQSLSAFVSFIVTIERYLCIVYSTKPNVRITRKIAIALLVLVGLLILGVNVTPVALQMTSPFTDYSCLNLHVPNKPFFLESIAYVSVISYVVSYILYARIFWTVRRSSLNVGIQREGKLAKRIITVITTNLLFLLGPMIAGQLLVTLYDLRWKTKIICWNAVLLWFLGINSFFNPLLYAFRFERFRRSLKLLMKGRPNEVGVVPSNN